MSKPITVNPLFKQYIMAIENPDKIGWTGKIWTEPKLSGYDKNNRGYGIDIEKNDSAKQLTEGRTGRWLTDSEMNQLMDEHISYIYDVARKHINNFDDMSPERQAALLGMLYRGDSVNKNQKYINLKEFDDKKFYDSVSNYYRSKGLNERANNSDKFFADKINRVEPKFSIIEPQDNTRVNKMEFIPAIERKLVPKPIPWGGPEPQTFGGYTPYMKNGSKIHIKKKNRGKFTSYCGGKVTDSCIQRAKASGNPTLVKRATFAQNARKWKHSKGGNLHKWSSNFGRTVDSNPNLDNMKGDYVSKKLIKKKK